MKNLYTFVVVLSIWMIPLDSWAQFSVENNNFFHNRLSQNPANAGFNPDTWFYGYNYNSVNAFSAKGFSMSHAVSGPKSSSRNQKAGGGPDSYGIAFSLLHQSDENPLITNMIRSYSLSLALHQDSVIPYRLSLSWGLNLSYTSFRTDLRSLVFTEQLDPYWGIVISDNRQVLDLPTDVNARVLSGGIGSIISYSTRRNIFRLDFSVTNLRIRTPESWNWNPPRGVRSLYSIPRLSVRFIRQRHQYPWKYKIVDGKMKSRKVGINLKDSANRSKIRYDIIPDGNFSTYLGRESTLDPFYLTANVGGLVKMDTKGGLQFSLGFYLGYQRIKYEERAVHIAGPTLMTVLHLPLSFSSESNFSLPVSMFGTYSWRPSGVAASLNGSIEIGIRVMLPQRSRKGLPKRTDFDRL